MAGHRDLGLQITVGPQMAFESILPYIVSFGKTRFNVSPCRLRLAAYVSKGLGHLWMGRMNFRRTLLHRLFRIKDSGQRLIIYPNKV